MRQRGNRPINCAHILVFSLAVLLGASCHHPTTTLPPSPSVNSYLDLAAGWRLRVVVPVLNNSDQPLSLSMAADGPLSFTVTASPNLKGFETQYYAVQGSRKRIILSLQRANITTDGQVREERQPLRNYLPIPKNARFVRLIYLTRSTSAPHDMAVVFARRTGDLDALTDRVARDANACAAAPEACLLIPASVAVITESLHSAAGSSSWQPVR